MQERVALRNETLGALEIEASLEAEADFADIIREAHDFSLGDPELASRSAARACDARRVAPFRSSIRAAISGRGSSSRALERSTATR